MSLETLPVAETPHVPVVETRRFAALNPPDMPRRADTGKFIERRDNYTGAVVCALNAVTLEGGLERHPCTAAVHSLILEKRPDFNKKTDYLLRFVDGVVVAIEPAARPTNLAGFAVDDPDAKAKAATWVFHVYEGGSVAVNNIPERVSPQTVDLVTNEVTKLASAGQLKVGQAVLQQYPVKEIRLLVGYQQVYLDNASRLG